MIKSLMKVIREVITRGVTINAMELRSRLVYLPNPKL
jgi:hypothetical protein